MAPTTTEQILSCVTALREGIEIPFVVIGGASVVLQGSSRTTEDVDILVPANTTSEALAKQLEGVAGFTVTGGAIKFRAAGSSTDMPIDVLTHAVSTFTFEDLGPHTILNHGVTMMRWDFALAVKLTCYYYRADDDNGEHKKRSDARDMVFLSRKMLGAGQTISDECASQFKIGYYHMMVIREALEPEEFVCLVEVGVEKLLLPWEENSDEQKEYYLCMAEEGSNPLTTPLE